MNIPWKTIFTLTKSIVEAAVPAVGQVETVAKTIIHLKDLSGQAKQDAVLAVVKDAVVAAENLTNKDLLNDADVDKATRGVIDAVVALQNIIAAKKAA
jgi:hypothetical protein